MNLINLIPRKFGDLFFLIDIQKNNFLKVNETVYDLVSVYEISENSPERDAVLNKYNLSEENYSKHIFQIIRKLNEN